MIRLIVSSEQLYSSQPKNVFLKSPNFEFLKVFCIPLFFPLRKFETYMAVKSIFFFKQLSMK